MRSTKSALPHRPADSAPDTESGELSTPPGTLSAQQQRALVKLAEGDSVVASAKAAGVSRYTVHRWLRDDPAFAAAYNLWQQESLATARARLVALTSDAVTAVGVAVEKGDVKTALVVLKALGILAKPKPGPTDPAEVQREQAITARRRERELVSAEAMDGFDHDDPRLLRQGRPTDPSI